MRGAHHHKKRSTLLANVIKLSKIYIFYLLMAKEIPSICKMEEASFFDRFRDQFKMNMKMPQEKNRLRHKILEF